MPEVSKRLEFDYGHRVLGHGGHCRHLHGHRGVAEIAVRSGQTNGLGMVVDFGCIKDKIGSWLTNFWDHNILLNPADPLLPHLQQTEERKPYVMQGNPTAELMAWELYRVIYQEQLLPPELVLVRVRIYETPTAWADCVGLYDR